MKSLFKVFFCLYILAAIGCATTIAPTLVHNTNGMPDEDLVTIYASKVAYAEKTIYAPLESSFSLVFDSNKTIVIKGPSGSRPSIVNEIKLQPGKYVISAKCSRNLKYAFPTTMASVELGKSYVLVCEADREIGFFRTESKYSVKVISLEQAMENSLIEVLKGVQAN